VLEEDAVEHGEDDSLLGLGKTADALELALELGGGATLAGGLGGGWADDADEDVGGDVKEVGELGDEGHGETEAADFVVGQGLLGDAEVGGDGLLGEAGLLAQLREATTELFAELAIGGHHVGLPRGEARGLGRREGLNNVFRVPTRHSATRLAAVSAGVNAR
jgi:hypothetical protein